MKVNTWQMLASSVLVAVMAGVSTSAEWVGVETRPLPVDRLVRNLEERISRDSSNINLRVNLARLHAYTFATHVATVGETKDGWAADGTTRPTYDLILRVVPTSPEDAS